MYAAQLAMSTITNSMNSCIAMYVHTYAAGAGFRLRSGLSFQAFRKGIFFFFCTSVNVLLLSPKPLTPIPLFSRCSPTCPRPGPTLQAKSSSITSSLGVAGSPASPLRTTIPARGSPPSTRRPSRGGCTRLGWRRPVRRGERAERRRGDCVALASCGAPQFYDAPWRIFTEISNTRYIVCVLRPKRHNTRQLAAWPSLIHGSKFDE